MRAERDGRCAEPSRAGSGGEPAARRERPGLLAAALGQSRAHGQALEREPLPFRTDREQALLLERVERELELAHGQAGAAAEERQVRPATDAGRAEHEEQEGLGD